MCSVRDLIFIKLFQIDRLKLATVAQVKSIMDRAVSWFVCFALCFCFFVFFNDSARFFFSLFSVNHRGHAKCSRLIRWGNALVCGKWAWNSGDGPACDWQKNQTGCDWSDGSRTTFAQWFNVEAILVSKNNKTSIWRTALKYTHLNGLWNCLKLFK